eukprot:618427-Amphidinium_carterae.1
MSPIFRFTTLHREINRTDTAQHDNNTFHDAPDHLLPILGGCGAGVQVLSKGAILSEPKRPSTGPSPLPLTHADLQVPPLAIFPTSQN